MRYLRRNGCCLRGCLRSKISEGGVVGGVVRRALLSWRTNGFKSFGPRWLPRSFPRRLVCGERARCATGCATARALLALLRRRRRPDCRRRRPDYRQTRRASTAGRAPRAAPPLGASSAGSWRRAGNRGRLHACMHTSKKHEKNRETLRRPAEMNLWCGTDLVRPGWRGRKRRKGG